MTNMPQDPKSFKFFQNASPQAFEKARALRKNLTVAEDKLWQALRGRKIAGLKFRRQHPFEEYILDFFCAEKMLVVEVDGGYHQTKEQIEYDENRTAFLEEKELKVLRFKNEEVEGNIEKVLNSIKEYLK